MVSTEALALWRGWSCLPASELMWRSQERNDDLLPTAPALDDFPRMCPLSCLARVSPHHLPLSQICYLASPAQPCLSDTWDLKFPRGKERWRSLQSWWLCWGQSRKSSPSGRAWRKQLTECEPNLSLGWKGPSRPQEKWILPMQWATQWTHQRLASWHGHSLWLTKAQDSGSKWNSFLFHNNLIEFFKLNIALPLCCFNCALIF